MLPKDFKEIKDLGSGFDDESISENTKYVNKLLKEGWIIINTYKSNAFDPQFPSAEAIHYVLGLPYKNKDELPIID